MDFFEKTISSQRIYDGKIIGVRKDTVELQDGRKASREVVEHSGGVCVIALDEDKNVLFVRQFRYPNNSVILEIPAGKLNPGEDHYECGKKGIGGGDRLSLLRVPPHCNNLSVACICR